MMTAKGVQIVSADSTDIGVIQEIHKASFGSDAEANLVSAILQDPSAAPVLSLCASIKGKIVGHILFSKATLEHHTDVDIYLLAPLAVLPDAQNLGIGGKLISEGLSILKDRRTEIVFVLGYPEYYTKFGFIKDAKAAGFPPTYEIDERNKDAWMYQCLVEPNSASKSGKVICCNALNKEEYWKE